MVSIKYRKVLAKKGLLLDPDHLKWPIHDMTRAKAAKTYANRLFKAGKLTKTQFIKINRAANIAQKIYASGGTSAEVARKLKTAKLYLS